MDTKSCSYCGQLWKENNGTCAYCGAPVKLNGIAKYDPFFHNGYIVYSFRDYARRSFEFVFYKGVAIVGRVFVTEEEMFQLSPVEDYMSIVMNKLELQERQAIR